MTRRGIAALVVGAILLSTAGLAVAHWCSNIFASPARFVVKPERSTVYVGSGGTKFRVYLQNNWPYKLTNVKMQGTASGYTITVTPSGQNIHPGQNVSYMFTISGPTGNKAVSTMNLQMDFRLGSWRSESDCMVSQSPAQSLLIDGATKWTPFYVCGVKNQTTSLNAATLADNYQSATLPSTSPFFGRTGLEQLIHWFGYPFCYNTGDGSHICGTSNQQECPNGGCAEGSPKPDLTTWTQNLMRAGAEVAVRKSKLGSLLGDARDKAVNAIKHGSDQHMCLGAVVGGYLWQGVAAPNAFTNMLTSSSAANNLPDNCAKAGWRAFNGSQGQTCSGSWPYEEVAACAAAEGLRNNNGPVVTHLIANAGDGASGGDPGLFYSYMLYIVQGYRKASTGYVPFYPDAGAPTTDGAAPPPDLVPPPDTKPWPDTKPPADTKPPPDTKPAADTKPWPKPDTKPWPTPDKGVKKDTKPWPTPDGTVADQSTDDQSTDDQSIDDITLADSQLIEDGPVILDTGNGPGQQNKTLDGGCGCEVGAQGDVPSLVFVVLFGLGLAWRRRRKNRQ